MFGYIVHYIKTQRQKWVQINFLWRESPSYSNFCCSLWKPIADNQIPIIHWFDRCWKKHHMDYKQTSFLHWFASFHVGIHSDVIWKRNTRPLYHVYFNVTHTSLQWRHNGRVGVSNHQHRDCLLNRLFRRRSKKTSKLRVTGLRAGISPVTGEFPAQMTSNAEKVSIWWRHHNSRHNDMETLSPLYWPYVTVTLPTDHRGIPLTKSQ